MSFAAAIRSIVESMLSSRDYVLKDRFAPMRGYSDFLELARQVDFSPGTIIDVGVADGTPWLYQAFPESHLVLVEPLETFSGPINRILRSRPAEWHKMAAGMTEGELTINVMNSAPSSSSARAFSDEQQRSFVERGIDAATTAVTVPLRRLDSLDTSNWPKPWLLKIDVEGAECEALEGAAGLLGEVRMVIAETAIGRVHGSSNENGDLINTLSRFASMGFHLYDIVNMQARGRLGRVTMIDGVFLKTGDDMLSGSADNLEMSGE